MNRHAFTLIEVMVATLLASMVTGLLFSFFSLINKTVRITEQRMNFETKSAWLQHYVERDLAGACLVLQPDEQQTPTAAASADNKQPAESEKKEAPKKSKKIEKIFIYSHQGSQFESLNFITNNALPRFWGAKEVKLRPLIARVTYRLEEQKNSKGSFELVRQEGPELEQEKFNAAQNRRYTLVDGLKDLSVKFTAKLVEESEEKKNEESPEPKSNPAGQKGQQQLKETKKESKKIKITFKEVDDWSSDAIEKNNQAAQKEKKKGPVQKLIPVYVEVSGSFWDEAKKRTLPFNFIVPILGDAEFKKRPKQQASIFGFKEQPDNKAGSGQQNQGQQNKSGQNHPIPTGNVTPPASAQAERQHENTEASLKRMLGNMLTCAQHSMPVPAPNTLKTNTQGPFARMPS